MSDVTPTAVTTPRIAATLAVTKEKQPRARPKVKDTWWRHVVAIAAVVVSLFPVVYVLR